MGHPDTTRATRRRFCTSIAAGVAAAAGLSKSAGAAETPPDVPLVTTRDHFDIRFGHVVRNPDYGPTEYGTNGAVPGIDAEQCPSDLTVFVHGFKTKAGRVTETVADARHALETNGYGGTTIGYSWDSDNGFWNWWQTTEIARHNGPKLAAFVDDYLSICGGQVRLVGYSLGAQVVLAAVEALADWGWDDQVDAVALLGAAADEDAPSLEGRYGSALETRAGRVDNYWKDDDAVLELAYESAEWADALGACGIAGTPPSTYADHRVDYVPDHFSYYEAGDGCMHEVVENW